MAKELGDLIVRLSLDSSKFEDGLKRMEAQMSKVQSQFKSSTTGLTDFGKVTEKLQGSASTLTQRLTLQQERVAQLEKAYEESKRVKGEDAEETQKLAKKLDDAKAAVTRTEKALETVNAQIKLNQNGWYQLGVNLDNVGEKLQKVGKSMTFLGTKLSLTVTAPIVALGTKAIKAGVEFESAFAGVKKTVEASEEEFKGLSDSIKEMSERIPATTSELSGIMEMAGQLGVKGSEHLKKFTEVIAALGVSTNLTREDAATMLAQFANITKMDLGNIDKLGSVIVALGNNFATTESDIVSMGQGLAAAGHQLGMSEAQIMAFAASLSSVGVEAEAGGTAFSKLLINMKVAAETGMKGNEVLAKTGMSLRELELLANNDGKAFKELAGKLGLTTIELRGFMSSASDLDNFAKVTGITAEQFAKAYGEDAAGALMQFLAGLNAIDASGGSAIVTLDEMGITETRLRDAILRAAGATDKFTEAQDLANEAWVDNAALTNEAGQRYATTESQLVMLKNAANNLAIQFGDIMVPVMMKVVDKLRGLIDWMKGLSEAQKENIIKIAAIAAALGPLLVITGKMVTSIGSIMRVLAPLAKHLGGAKTATGAFGKALTLLTGPVGIVLAVIAALAAIFVHFYKTNEEFRDKVNAVWAQVCAAFENVKGILQNTFASLQATFAGVMESVGMIWEKCQDMLTRLAPLFEAVFGIIAGVLGGFVALVASVANGIMLAAGPLMEAMMNAVDIIVSVIGALVALLTGDFSGAWQYVQDAIIAFSDTAKNILVAIGAFFVGTWQTLCAIAEGFGVNLNAIFAGIWEALKSGVVVAWEAVTSWLSATWDSIATSATGAWNTICVNVSNAISSARAGIESAWTAISTGVSNAWTAFSSTATSAWNTITTSVKTATTAAQTGIQAAWTSIANGISNAWTSFSSTAASAWTNITNSVKTSISGAQAGITGAWNSIKAAIKSTWDGVTAVFQAPINSAISWLNEKVAWMKGLFNFSWSLPSFKLPKIDVSWNEVGWGIKIPSLSLRWNALGGIFDKPTIFATRAGMQGVGEAGPEAILPLNTLWDEMSSRLRYGMREIMRETDGVQQMREERLLRMVMELLKDDRPGGPRRNGSFQFTQNIYAKETSYAGQQREAARQFRQIARAMG